MNLPTYKIANTEFSYAPRCAVTSLDWYNIAHCARQRMADAHFSFTDKELDAGFLRWKRERETFWTLVRKSLPEPFI